MIGKGGGSAYGGEWKPSKPEDQRLIGRPGEIKVTYKKDGTKVETKIGTDGRAVMERHYTDHKQPWVHSDPHDHQIRWDAPRYGIPNFIKPHINYWPSDYPEGAPEFKAQRRNNMYQYYNYCNTEEDNRFKTISEFKDCMVRGGEVEFLWKGIHYSVTHYNDNISISHSCRQDTEMKRETADEILEYMVGEDRLRDVITKVSVLLRTI